MSTPFIICFTARTSPAQTFECKLDQSHYRDSKQTEIRNQICILQQLTDTHTYRHEFRAIFNINL
jgi:hypothetical protein